MGFQVIEFWRQDGMHRHSSPVPPIRVDLTVSGMVTVQTIDPFTQTANMSMWLTMSANQTIAPFESIGFIAAENTRIFPAIVQTIEPFTQDGRMKIQFLSGPSRKIMIPRRQDRIGYLHTFIKQPREYLDLDFDFTDWLKDHPSDSLNKVEYFVEPLGLVVDHPVVMGNIVKVPYQAGLDNTTYKITLVVSTNEGRIVEFDFRMWVKDF